MEGNVNDKKFAKVTDLTFITRSKVPYFEAKDLKNGFSEMDVYFNALKWF